MARLLGKHKIKTRILAWATVIFIILLSSCTTQSTPATQTAETPSPTVKKTTPPEKTIEPTPHITPDLIVNQTTHGRIKWDEIWRGEIHIIGDIVVDEGCTLTIEPGTKVLIAAKSDIENLNTDPEDMKQGINSSKYIDGNIFPGEPYFDEGNHISIRIRGRLNAIGTPDQMITITSDSPTPQMYDWNTFNFNSGILSYCIVEYYWNLGPGEDTVVSNNILRYVGGCAVCLMERSALIEDNAMSYAGHELIDTHGGSPIIRKNKLGPNPGHLGIHAEGPLQIIGNIITECGGGIGIFGGSPHIIDNTIQNNMMGVLLSPNSKDVIIDRNAILENNDFINNSQDFIDRRSEL